MKTIVCSLAFCLLCTLGYSQFQHSFGTESSEMGRSLTQLQKTEKGYLVAGYTSAQFIAGLDATLVKTDLDGNQIWSHVYGGERRDYFNSVRQSTNFSTSNPASYIVAGVTNSFGFGRSDALLTGVDVNGNPVFAGVYGGQRYDAAHCVQNIKDVTGRPGYIFVGETRSYNAFPDTNMYVVQTDISGNLARATVIGGEGHQRGMWIEQTKDGGYIIVGSTTENRCGGSAELPNSPTDLFIVKLRPNLTIEWNRILGYPKELDPTISYRNVATCVKENRNGDYVITGYTNGFGINNSQDAFLLFISANGNFLGMKTYGTERTEIGRGLQITTTASGSELYTVVGLKVNSTRKAMMFQTDAGGNLLWARHYGHNGNEGGVELVTDDFDKGFAFTGYTTSLGAGGIDIYLTETNGIGESKTTICERKIELKEIKHEPCITKSAQQIFVDEYKRIQLPHKRVEYKEDRCGTAIGARTTEEKAAEKETGIMMFPNPAQHLLNIQSDTSMDITGAEVFDLQGKKVIKQQKSDPNGEIKLSTYNLNPGTYIIKISTKNGGTHIKRFLKL